MPECMRRLAAFLRLIGTRSGRVYRRDKWPRGQTYIRPSVGWSYIPILYSKDKNLQFRTRRRKYSVVRSYCKNALGTGPFDFYKRMFLSLVILMSVLQCTGFVRASEYSYKQDDSLTRNCYKRIARYYVVNNCSKFVLILEVSRSFRSINSLI